VEIWQSAIEAAPEDLTIRIRLAEILSSINRTDQALKVLQESVELFDSAEAWRHLAGFLRVQGDLKAAREALEESMERSRSVAPSLRFTLADLLIEEGNYERALSIAESLEEPSYRAMIRGAILLQQGDAAAALELLDSGLRLYPNNAGARYLAGQAALATGETERAMAEFREAIRVSETETDAALRLAEFNFREGEYLNAIGFADRHIAKRPYVDPTAHIISARSSIIAGNYEQAEGTLSNLRLNAPTQPVSFLEFAELKRVTAGPEAALEVLLQADFDLTQPANSAMLRAVAQDFLSLGKGVNALALVDEALAAHPDHPDFHDLRGRVLLSLGRQAEADTAFSSALNLDPRFAPSLEARGSYALWSGDLANALAYFEKAAQAAPSNAQYVYLQAQIRYMQSDSERAEGLFRQALELNPGHVGANNDLAWLLASQSRDLDAANDLADRAVRMDMNADTLDTLGFIRLQAGDPKAASEVFRKALEHRPDSPSIEFRLGLALSANGEKEAAREMFQKALRTPDFPEAEAAKAELSNLESS
jgi:tetratricopeptide (TPR) repeat protein